MTDLEAPYRCVICGADVPLDDADCAVAQTGRCICRTCFDRETGVSDRERLEKRLRDDVEQALRDTTPL